MIEAGIDLISNDVHRLHPSPASYFNYASQGPHPMYDQHGLRNLSYYLDYCLPFIQIHLENWNLILYSYNHYSVHSLCVA